MYKPLADEIRPSSLDEVVGQEHITETLKNQIITDRLSHAYLFIGTRGTGKTTCAKILAKALNCQHPENGNPCCKCPACLGIEDGSILDVVEIDAASNNRVDDVRQLREEAVFSPVSVKKRVYIIDEVHMLSNSAFNALLKILEEPPAYAFFILMTENASAILPTILSRCTQFSLAPLTAPELTALLREQYPDRTDGEIQSAAAAAQGIAGNAAELLSGEIGQAAALAAPFLRALAARNEMEILRAANACLPLTRRQFAHVLSALAVSLRDAVFAAQSLSGVLLPALEEESRSLASHDTVRQLLAMYDWTQELLTRIDRNQSLPLLTGCLAARCYEYLIDPTL